MLSIDLLLVGALLALALRTTEELRELRVADERTYRAWPVRLVLPGPA